MGDDDNVVVVVLSGESFLPVARVKPQKRITRIVESDVLAMFFVPGTLIFPIQTLFIHAENRKK